MQNSPSDMSLSSFEFILIKHAFTNGNRTGCRFITVDAYAEATAFYQKNGFDFFTKRDEHEDTRLMYFDLKPFKDAQALIKSAE